MHLPTLRLGTVVGGIVRRRSSRLLSLQYVFFTSLTGRPLYRPSVLSPGLHRPACVTTLTSTPPSASSYGSLPSSSQPSESRSLLLTTRMMAMMTPSSTSSPASSRKSSFAAAVPEDMTFLTQDEASKIDVELFDEYGFTIDQLMELAGLAVATAIAKAYPPPSFHASLSVGTAGAKASPPSPRILICAGPGNNGGDGLVAARHLKWFGYDPCIFYPKQPSKPLFAALRRQCDEMEIPFMSFLPEASLVDQNFTLVVDALFGFGFKPPVRPEFVEVLQKMCKIKVPIVSVDVPSGWDVEMGPHADSMKPAMIISLTAPKKCVQNYKGKHFLGGRFVPSSLATKFNLRLPPYPGTELVIQLQ